MCITYAFLPWPVSSSSVPRFSAVTVFYLAKIYLIAQTLLIYKDECIIDIEVMRAVYESIFLII